MSAPTPDHRTCAWITGAGGLIGSWLVLQAPAGAGAWRARALVHSELELTQSEAVRRLFERERPGLVLHCAAMSRSEDCQAAPQAARRVNVEATRLLAELAADIPLVFFSTDLVFDGRQGNYTESAQVNPLSVYAETKAVAEQFILSNPRHTVVRTSLNAGPSPAGDRGFDEQMLRAWAAGKTLRLFTDEYRSPIAAEATAAAVWKLVGENRPGLYHVAGSERLSRWEIGQLVASNRPDTRARVEPALLAEYHGAPRSPDTSLNCAKVEKLLSRPLPRWSDWLRHHPPPRA